MQTKLKKTNVKKTSTKTPAPNVTIRLQGPDGEWNTGKKIPAHFKFLPPVGSLVQIIRPDLAETSFEVQTVAMREGALPSVFCLGLDEMRTGLTIAPRGLTDEQMESLALGELMARLLRDDTGFERAVMAATDRMRKNTQPRQPKAKASPAKKTTKRK